MSSVIDGKSHQTIKFMRDKPAALAVLWIYASRTNPEGVAWPSLRGLAKTTDWSVPVCQDGRDYLVEHGALEQVDNYIRPQWRKLSLADLTRKRNFDRAQYYRVTGVFTHGGNTYPLFYHGGNEASDIEDDGSDVQPGLTSDGVAHQTALHVQPGCTELDSSIPELDSKKSELSTRKQRTPTPQPLQNSAQTRSKQNSVPTPNVAAPLPPNYAALEDSFKPLSAIIIAWHDAHPVIKPSIPRNQRERYNDEANALLAAGITPGDMTVFVKERLKNGQKTTWAFIVTDIHDFMRSRNRHITTATPQAYTPPIAAPALTREQIEAIKADVLARKEKA